MKFRDFQEALESGEGLHIEFKRIVNAPERFAHEMIAFANTSGGAIFIGVEDDGSVVGVNSEKTELDHVEQAARLSDPPLTYSTSIISFGTTDVVCVEIPESRNKPHFHIGTGDGVRLCYVRVGEHSVHASREMIKVLEHQTANDPVRLIIGEAERRLLQHLETHDRITVQEFAQLTNISDRRASRLLVRLVRAGILAIHTLERSDFFTLVREPD